MVFLAGACDRFVEPSRGGLTRNFSRCQLTQLLRHVPRISGLAPVYTWMLRRAARDRATDCLSHIKNSPHWGARSFVDEPTGGGFAGVQSHAPAAPVVAAGPSDPAAIPEELWAFARERFPALKPLTLIESGKFDADAVGKRCCLRTETVRTGGTVGFTDMTGRVMLSNWLCSEEQRFQFKCSEQKLPSALGE